MTDLKSVGHCGRVGSSPILGTINHSRFKKASVICIKSEETFETDS